MKLTWEDSGGKVKFLDLVIGSYRVLYNLSNYKVSQIAKL